MTSFYIGTYTSGASRGIYRADLNLDTGLVSQPELVAELDNPAFLTLHPQSPLLFSCSEIRRDGKREGARLVAYRIENSGGLTPISSQPTQGSGPCYVATDSDGRVALVAHYASGSVAALPIAGDGALSPVTVLNQHTGSGPRTDRQEGPHAHCIVADPSNRFACAVDLGTDQVLIYGLDAPAGKISLQPKKIYRASAGSGPRHLTFHPNGQFAFLINEMASTLSALRWDAAEGELSNLHTLSTLPDGYSGESITAEVLVHPNGRYVYGSNRGHDSLVVFQFDAAAGKLKTLQHISTGGKTPRNFRIDPSGQFLLAANQDSDSIVPFRIDPNNGQLTPTGQLITVGSPSCVKFVNARIE